ncbi:hypothetical protein VPHD148_0002 [Vibrio phage D148]
MSDEITFNFEDVDTSIDFDAPQAEVENTEEPEQDQDALDSEAPQKHPEHDEYLAIYDAMMFEDKYEKTYKLGKRYNCVISTRSADADLKISRNLDGQNFKTMHALQSLSALLTLSYSLVELNGKDLRDMTTMDRYEFIRGKSSHIIEMLSRHMVDFDSLVREALSYGELNF